MGRRTLEKDRDLNPEVRSEILARLMPFFIETGMSQHSMDDLVRYLKIGKGTFYRHFHSRDELFNLFIEYVVDKILPACIAKEY
jgi:AcrR family transcriptional regulator